MIKYVASTGLCKTTKHNFLLHLVPFQTFMTFFLQNMIFFNLLLCFEEECLTGLEEHQGE